VKQVAQLLGQTPMSSVMNSYGSSAAIFLPLTAGGIAGEAVAAAVAACLALRSPSTSLSRRSTV
jgi:hypothetical protein